MSRSEVPEPPAWHALAACRGRTDVMFPAAERDRGVTPAAVHAEALSICASCPVREPCRIAGAHERYGVWGGTTPAERTRARKRQAAQPAA